MGAKKIQGSRFKKQPGRSPRCNQGSGDRYAKYEQAKGAWVCQHPAATAAEYEVAMRGIALQFRV
jgi:hypothetical protein